MYVKALQVEMEAFTIRAVVDVTASDRREIGRAKMLQNPITIFPKWM
jgi:hypothetical protein